MKTFGKLIISIAIIALAACGVANKIQSIELSGAVKVDGSSTVYPITEAVAENLSVEPGVNVTVGVSGTGDGFKNYERRN